MKEIQDLLLPLFGRIQLCKACFRWGGFVFLDLRWCSVWDYKALVQAEEIFPAALENNRKDSGSRIYLNSLAMSEFLLSSPQNTILCGTIQYPGCNLDTYYFF